MNAFEDIVRRYLEGKGCTLSSTKKPGETGPDITARCGKFTWFVEVIGFESNPPTRSRDFYEAFFRVISRDRGNPGDILIIGLPKRFKNCRSVPAYFGITPRQYSSGETRIMGRISKCGNSYVRSLLYQAAHVILTRTAKWSKLKAWGMKIQRKHGLKKAAIAVARKLAIIMYRMLITRKSFVHGEPKKKKEKKGVPFKTKCKEEKSELVASMR